MMSGLIYSVGEDDYYMEYCDGDWWWRMCNSEGGFQLDEHFPRSTKLRILMESKIWIKLNLPKGSQDKNQINKYKLESSKGSQAGCYVCRGAHQLVLKQMRMMPMMMLVVKITAMIRSFPAGPIAIIQNNWSHLWWWVSVDDICTSVSRDNILISFFVSVLEVFW